MVKKQSIIKFFISFVIVAIFMSGLFLSIDFNKSTSFAQTPVVEAAEMKEVEPELMLDQDADFLVDYTGQFTGFSADAKSRIENATTFGVVFPTKVKSLKDYTNGTSPFYTYRTKLTNVEFADGSEVEKIGNYIFYSCANLTKITIPENIVNIGKSVFSGCSALTNINIPDNVTSIGTFAFSGCSNLTNINIPKNIISIDDHAFYNCSGLTSMIIDGGQSIKEGTFEGCSGLTSVKISNSVRSIGNSAFSGCSALTSINIPDNVTSISPSAFYGCENVVFIAGSKEKATLFQNDESFNLTDYKDRITYTVEIQFKNGTKNVTQKKLYKQDATWCLQEDGTWKQDEDYQLPDLDKGYWQDEEGNEVSLEALNAMLKNGEIENSFALNFVEQIEDKPTDDESTSFQNSSQTPSWLWILLGVSGGVVCLAAILITLLILRNKKKKSPSKN